MNEIIALHQKIMGLPEESRPKEGAGFHPDRVPPC